MHDLIANEKSSVGTMTAPRHGQWGYLVTNSLGRNAWTRGSSCFVWFATREELERSLETVVTSFTEKGVEELPLAQYAPEILTTVKRWQLEGASLEERKETLNRVFRCDSMLLWVGCYQDLCEPQGTYQQGIRNWLEDLSREAA